MLLTDLFEKVEPGQRRAIQLQIDKYEKAIRNIEQYETNFQNLDYNEPLPGTEQQLEDLKKAYQAAIDKLRAEINSKTKGADALEKLIIGIQKNCKTVLAAMKKTNLVLYRGTKESAPAFYGKPFENRQSKDSYSHISAAFNNAMKEAGAIARRDNSIFCTTKKSFADMFGHQIYIVFPRDPMHFTWSDAHKDLVLNNEHLWEMADMEMIKEIMTVIWRDEKLKEEYITQLMRYITPVPRENVIFDPNDFPSSEDNFNHYYPFSSRYKFGPSWDALKDILPTMGKPYDEYADFSKLVSTEAVVKNFGLHIDEDLVAAFEKGWEITVNAEYYAIRVDYEQKVRKLLGMSRYSGAPSDSSSDDDQY